MKTALSKEISTGFIIIDLNIINYMYVYISTTMQVKPYFKREKKCSKEKKTCFFLIQINNDKDMCVLLTYNNIL